MHQKEDSIKKRYFYRLLTNVLIIPMGIITQTLIARSLGPAAYGDFSFLTNFFTRIITFLENGTSTFYYTKLSQRPEDKGLVKFYWIIFGVVAGLSLIFVLNANLFNYKDTFWPNQAYFYILMALAYSLIIYFYKIIHKMVDAHALTIKGELLRMLIKIFGLIVLITVYFTITLNLTLFFIYNYLINGLLILSFWYVLKKNNISVFPSVKLPLDEIKKYGQEFYKYSHPLIVLSFILLVSSLLDIWLLQKISGSVQQGYYGFAHKIAAISFLFAGSLTSIIMREYSKSFANYDIENMRKIFQTYIPPIYVLIAFIGVFISVNSYNVVGIFGGDEFLPGKTVLSVMVLYPIHQSYGQLSGSVFFAAGRTKEFRNISAFTAPIGMIISLFLLLPEKYGGLEAGALGLAIKMVLMQFIAVNIQLWKNAKFLNFSFFKLLFHQLYVIAIFFIIGLLSSLLVSLAFNLSMIFSFIINGIIYSFISLTLFYFKSNVFMLYYRVDSRKLIVDTFQKVKTFSYRPKKNN